jgi:proteasome accessory factor B
VSQFLLHLVARRHDDVKKKDGPYASARKLHALRAMLNAPHGATVYDIMEKLGVVRQSAIRLLHALEDAGEALEEERDGQRKVWRIKASRRSETFTLTTAQMVALSVARRSFEFLSGTGFKEDLDDLFERVEATLKRKTFVAAKNLEKKIYDVNEAPHRYEESAEIVNEIVTALLEDERVTVRHESVSGGDRVFDVDPYTLVLYKKGLYLAGWSHHHASIRTFALGGLKDVDRKRGEKFEYPKDYSPAERFGGSFGLFGGAKTRVVVRFTKTVARFVKRRQWHPSQALKELADGGVRMTLEVNGTTELVTWLLGFAEHAMVEEPPALREEIVATIERMHAAYEERAT